jgi:hypothetical protein
VRDPQAVAYICEKVARFSLFFSTGWDFKPAQQELMGSFEILNYVACAPQDPCGIEAPPPNNTPRYDGIGALININYHPAPTDPQPGQKRIH